MTPDPSPENSVGTGNGALQIRFWTLAILGAGALIYLFHDMLLPFVVGMAIAYFLDPAADKLEEWNFPRGAAAASLIVGFLVLLITASVFLAPVLRDQLLGFLEHLPAYVDRGWSVIAPMVERIMAAVPGEREDDLSDISVGASDYVVDWLGRFVRDLWEGAGAFFNLLALMLITPVVAFYLLRDWDHMVEKVTSWLPRPHAIVIREQLGLIDDALAGFVRGQAMVCVTLGSLYAIGWSLVGLEFGLVVGLLTGLMAFIPYAGAFLGFLIALALGFGQFWPDVTSIAMIAGVFAIIQTMDGTFITPRLMGHSVGLHPVWILFALLAGGTLMGFVGVLIAVPTAAALGVLARFGIGRYLLSPMFLGGDPVDQDAKGDE
jgi:predicted PurR-regulated permease PerM